MSEHTDALNAMDGIPASVGFCEPVEGYRYRPHDAVRTMQEMAHSITTLRQQLQQAEEENERVRQANLDVMMHFDDMKAEKEKAEARCEFLEGSIKNAIGWIDGDLRDIIRDVGNQICSYNDLYESADRIEHLLAEALRQQAAESENG